ncbi:alcohol acyl transferase 1 allele RGa-like [Lycium barbarum]|uniref:alcohol acyl transferase 1 allele RGa-like n=1 Tax=Lycium barbarum TaxID=112863 RepID=UPI00293F66E1|nr:alcohol acyl transferase 1 allele RGa-like [Lycium barbarum]XP_060211177.1 alcohol acyl transferase 1 allele RGa-like [Lycium barbarum]XP_060211178.1 alcohol acyl transferase 1 allele RGa-like [Lycium barbarum]
MEQLSPSQLSVIRRESELIIPATATPREIKHLSDIDDREGLRFHISNLFFYEHNPSMEGIDPAKVIKDGLSKALVFYYPLAGRLILGPKGKHMVNCNGEGILFTEAYADVELDMLGESIKPPCPFLEDLLYNVPGSDGITDCPLMLIQVTRFTCGGFAVAVRVNHTMVDAFGLVLFLNAVTDFVKFKASAPSIIPVWQRDTLNARPSPRITCKHHEFEEEIESTNAWLKLEKELIQRSFFFGEEEIEAIRNQVSPVHRSSGRFELLTSFLWRHRTISLNLNPEEIVRLTYFVTARGRFEHLKIPHGYYGNAFAFPAAVSKAGLLSTYPLTYALELIKKAKNQVNEEYFRSMVDFMVIKGRPGITQSWNFAISNTAYVGFDKVDFGWGEPKYGGAAKVDSCFSFFVAFKNYKGQKGILTTISLPPKAMERFEDVMYKLTSNVKQLSKL